MDSTTDAMRASAHEFLSGGLRSLWLTVALLLGGCGGSQAGAPIAPQSPAPVTPAESTPVASGSNVPVVPYASAEGLTATITSAGIDDDGRPVVDFQLTDARNVAILDLTASDVRFVIAKLQRSPLGNLHGDWQSYLNRIESPAVGPGSAPRLQADYERGTVGELTNNADGSYRYVFSQAITPLAALPAAVQAQAALEGLDLSFDGSLTHRLAIQFDNTAEAENPRFDFIPDTGATSGLLRAQIVDTRTCNGCHDELAFHGGQRVEMDYCVTCHNPGTTDANSGESMDMPTLIHRLHRGRDLPSVRAGDRFGVYGFRDNFVDYSEVHYPQDIRACGNCHAGAATAADARAVRTPSGDNWMAFPVRAGCGGCHDDLDLSTHFGNQTDDSGCRSCHATGGPAGSVAASHALPTRAAATAFEFRLLGVSDTAPGAFPRVRFSVVDPAADDVPWDVTADAPFVQPAGASRLAVTLGWSTTDFTNTGTDAPPASTVSIDAAGATPLGDGSFEVVSAVAIPDGTQPPFVAASGSGIATLEGHPAVDIDGVTTRVPVPGAHRFFPIDEPDGLARARDEIVELERCNGCHDRLSLHGDNRTDDLQGCASCHNARNTDVGVRAIAITPPTDGKAEESLDFGTMIHGIHASGFRQQPLELVGFRGFTSYRYDTTEVQYPGRIDNCLGCHADGTWRLPLPAGRLGKTVSTGVDVAAPDDDTVATPATAICSSCHDAPDALAHMTAEGGSLATTQAMIDAGAVVENCAFCHGEGRSVAVDDAHRIRSLP